ncbi:AMP-binding protein [uncultured Corynebacterium sp.]|uniref:AMP-binding protein n=1 Tax=uncultured Corynebacterium sp. TaxID=159447 RepID=UPI0025FEC44B|nr:AMP-binding protein [uncultured Corynebacterium sp.]
MPIQSPQQDIDIPNSTIYDVLFGNIADEDLGRVAITDDATGSQTTYGELKALIDAFAGALAERGVKPGTVVGLHCPNSLAFAVAFHGILRAGATVTTLGSLMNTHDVAKQLKDSNATYVLTTKLLGEAGVQGAEEAGIDPSNIIDLTDEATGLRALVGEGRPAPEVTIDPATHVAVLPYSSGTTGVPKGVRLSHRNLVANILQIGVRLGPNGLDRDSVVMCVLPFFHIYGMNVLLNSCLNVRAHVVTMPSFDLENFLAAHQKHGITFTFIAPPIAVALAKHPLVDKFDIGTLETVLSGAAALDAQLADSVANRLGVRILQGFGMTETSPVTSVSDVGVTPLDSIGLPVSNTEVKIVDITTEDLEEIHPPANEGDRSAEGEMWVRGPQVMLGYLNNEEATANTITPDGWLRTGDIANLDHLGNAYVVDRMKELIKYKGYQVAPAELEALLMTHEAIADAAVVGYLRECDGEELPRAFLVLQQGVDPNDPAVSAEALMEWVAERVTPYKKIRMVEFIDAIPKSSTGKILRKDLKSVPVAAKA